MKLLKGLIEIPAAKAAGIDIYEYFLEKMKKMDHTKYTPAVFNEMMLAFVFTMRKADKDGLYEVDLRTNKGEGNCTCWPFKNKKMTCKHLMFMSQLFYNDTANFKRIEEMLKNRVLRQTFMHKGVAGNYEIRPVERTERLWVPDGYDVQDGVSEDSKV